MLTMSRSSYAGNVMNARRLVVRSKYHISWASQVDHLEWGMTPQTYNASYSPSNNEITLPAAQFLIPSE